MDNPSPSDAREPGDTTLPGETGQPGDAGQPDDAMLREETLHSEPLYQGRIVNLRRDTVRLADGAQAQREVVEHRPAVVILAIDAGGRIAFVRQWRTPIGRAVLELPAGVVDPGETPEAAAARELQEEVGLKPGRLEPVVGFYVAPGWATEYLHAFIARDCQPQRLPADADERIRVESYSLTEALALVQRGAIEDAKTIILLQALALGADAPSDG